MKGRAVIIGYTHYWYRKPMLASDKFAKASEDCKKICEEEKKNGVAIVYEYNKPFDPIFTADTVRFNGEGDIGHETFYIAQTFQSHYTQYDASQKKVFAFCKTANKPYDVAVCACLIIFKYWFPDIDVSSDGTMQDWMPAIENVRSIFGEDYVSNFSFDKDE